MSEIQLFHLGLIDMYSIVKEQYEAAFFESATIINKLGDDLKTCNLQVKEYKFKFVNISFSTDVHDCILIHFLCVFMLNVS